ncbi:hypothetical protein TNCV_4786751 [Trichonephila clavipes]|nr:hypothetical protein TNCV_4786751 [Trichonephila clavipes]
MSRFGGLSEERPSVFKTRSKLGTHLSTQCSGMKGRFDLAQPVNRTPDLWCGSTTRPCSTSKCADAYLYALHGFNDHLPVRQMLQGYLGNPRPVPTPKEHLTSAALIRAF